MKAIVREKPALIFDPALFGKMHLLIRRLVLVFETQSFQSLLTLTAVRHPTDCMHHYLL